MAGKFDDSQLRLQALKLKDPYDQPDLVFEWPEDIGLVDIINIYSFERYPTEKAFCVECHGRHHKHGFTALLTNGRRVMLGSSCGARRFGRSWTDAEKRIEQRADRQFELRRLDRLDRCRASFSGLAKIRHAMDRLSNLQKAFFNQMGELGSRVQEAAINDNGELRVHKEIRSQAATTAGLKRTTEAITITRVMGYRFVIAKSPSKSFARFEDALGEMVEHIGRTDKINTGTLARVRREFEQSFEGIEKGFDTHVAAMEFFRRPNFEGMIRWADNDVSGVRDRYWIEGDIVRSRSGGLQLMQLEPLESGLLTAIQEYRRAD